MEAQKMTKTEAVKMFRELYKRWGGRRADPIAKRTEWNDWTDSLCKDGLITDHQYNNRGNPF